MTAATLDTFIQVLAREDACSGDNDYNGEHWSARISSVFVVFVASAFGSFFPILSSRYSFIRLPSWCFFIAKYFGSGVIVATAFIHLLDPASEALGNDCLGAPFTEYPLAFGLCLITLMLLFFAELIAYKWIEEKLSPGSSEAHGHSHFGESDLFVKKSTKEDDDLEDDDDDDEFNHTHSHSHSHLHAQFSQESIGSDIEVEESVSALSFVAAAPTSTTGEASHGMFAPDHYSHAKEHQDPEVLGTPAEDQSREQYLGQLLNIMVLEFGVVFHSFFVGLTLAVSGDEFVNLYIVVVFHQLFEGLGLGSRIAMVDWTHGRQLTPWMLALAYSLCTPIAISIGLGVRTSYPPESRTALITNGVFDSISAGILVYTGLIELMAHEFLFSDEFKGKGSMKKMVLAYLVMCVGAGVMALLGKWT